MPGIIAAKKKYLVSLLQEDPKMDSAELTEKVRKKFETGVSGSLIKKVRLEVVPNYKPRNLRASEGNGKKKTVVDMTRLRNMLVKTGAKEEDIDRALYLASKQGSKVSADLIKLKQKTLNKAKDQLSKFSLACLS